MAFPQAAQLGKSCDLGSQGAGETKTFLAFDQELRGALSKQDAGMMALLVKFPLRINDEGGRYYLDDPASLQARFQEVFPSAIRRVVLDQRPETVFCNYAGIMYGNGALWVTRVDDRYAIETVNLAETGHIGKGPGYRVEFACQTDKLRVIVDKVKGMLRYRSWNKPRSLLEKPDTEITNGKGEIQGTGPCAYGIWTFTGTGMKIIVAGIGGCGDDQQPKNAVGTVEVSTKEQPEGTSWCF